MIQDRLRLEESRRGRLVEAAGGRRCEHGQRAHAAPTILDDGRDGAGRAAAFSAAPALPGLRPPLPGSRAQSVLLQLAHGGL
ncbi:MAG: hypothetical protein U5L11_05625 [Arhodomonas sp.]|nr:hypothetical protein [Arhodomonas sp.]